MTATLLQGRPVADAIWADVERRAAVLRDGGSPALTLAIVEAADDPASAAYLRQIQRLFERHGLLTARHKPAEPTQTALNSLLERLSGDAAVHGILLTQPLPAGLNLEAALRHLSPEKDVEGVHPWNAGSLAQGRPKLVPSTPLAGMEILAANGVELRGKHAVVVGRSPIVGRPLIQLLLLADATVTICHTRTVDLPSVTRQADVLLLAAGRADLIDGTMVRPGAVVVDFGINVLGDKLVGDAAFDSVCDVAGSITPVPGGVGPVTNAVLARNLVQLAELAAGG
ncbi:MAG: bifunctional 5,10-methylenetetrahydrofolate dehydrogenase/5,10-methenyltetrahydrofolate cyclohydrolase [Chloroflexi bacterium]|nr:bifunctional 5,10-methylenetetrahydrofolate dehydrogenase/5,10-methenyltetrahydrofolate cyclohydrolase [Chloroflexota bacterium]